MTGNKNLFSTLKNVAKGGKVTFGDNNQGQIIGKGKVGDPNKFEIKNVLLVSNLTFELLSVSQLCDNNLNVLFSSTSCKIMDKNNQVVLKGKREGNIYVLNMDDMLSSNTKCLVSHESDPNLWHRRLGHIGISTLEKLHAKSLVKGLPKLNLDDFQLCESCIKGKHVRESLKPKTEVTTSRILELLHIDLFGPCRTRSLGGSYYVCVIVDDFSRYTWTLFLASKDESASSIANLIRQLENEHESHVIKIRSDRGGEFKNSELIKFCNEKGIKHEFSPPRTPQLNGVVERKNRTIQEVARTMMVENKVPKFLWAEAVNTSSYMINRLSIRKKLNKTPFEILNGRLPKVNYLKVFGCKCFVLNTKDNLDKFDPKSDEHIFVGYSMNSKAYRCYNAQTRKIVESIHVKFNENAYLQTSNQHEIYVPNDQILHDEDELILPPTNDQIETPNQTLEMHEVQTPPTQEHNEENVPNQPIEHHEPIEDAQPSNWWQIRDKQKHPQELIIGDVNQGVRTRRQIDPNEYDQWHALISQIEPKNVNDALNDAYWIDAMHEELNQFERNNVWDLVPKPEDKSIIGTKWVFRNKMNEQGVVVRNKARLVAQGYNQEEGIDYDETFAPVARLESIRLLLAFACYNNIKLFQMDVKSAFLNGYIQEEVFVKQPPGFEDPKNPNHVYKLKKALYGLKQAPRAWYERFANFLLSNNFQRGTIDSTLFLKKKDKDLLVIQIYVDDIIFGSTNPNLVKDFEDCMKSEFEMSMVGELNYFLGLQIKQTSNGIHINQAKYIRDMIKKFNFENLKPSPTPMCTSTKLDKDENGVAFDEKLYRSMIGSLLYLTASRPDIMFAVCMCARFQSMPKLSHFKAVKRIFRYLQHTPTLGLWYDRQSSLSLHAYSDADYGGCRVDRKSTSGTCQFLGNSLISWFSKKQSSVALSTTEAEYMALSLCCTQLLWIKQQLSDFEIQVNNIPIYCDSTSAINLSKNPVLHSKAKHIEVRYHFLRDHVNLGHIHIEHVRTDQQVADIFTKPLNQAIFETLRARLGLIAYN